MTSGTVRLIARVSAYLPIVLTVVLLVVTTFNSDILKYVPLELMIAVSSLSYVLIAVHLETRLSTARDKFEDLAIRVKDLQISHKEYLDTLVPSVQTMSLAQGFDLVSRTQDRWASMRVFAVSSQQIVTFFRSHRLVVEKCEILIHEPPLKATRNRSSSSPVPFYIQDWRTLQREGFIGKLIIRSYDFLPTEYECIFDDRILLLGLYESVPTDYSRVKVGNVTAVRNSTQPGRQMIEEYRSRFDKLFDVCATHHGPNLYENG
jgi:hypothetical protein